MLVSRVKESQPNRVTLNGNTSEYFELSPGGKIDYTAVFVYLRVPAGGDHLEPDVAEGVEDHDGVGLDTDPVTGLAGRGGAGVAGTAGTVKLGL